MFIDDFIVTIRGQSPKAIQHIAITAMWELEVMVQQQIRASLVAKKAKVASNNQEVAQKNARATGMQMETMTQIEALGVDIGAGMERNKWKEQAVDKRIKKN